MHFKSYLQSAKEILQRYECALPFAAWLKAYFREHKKFGSRDRKAISDLCFCYYRMGTAAQEQTVEDRLLLAQALCHQSSAFVAELKNEWTEVAAKDLKKKLSFFGLDEISLFPFADELSKQIEWSVFCRSHLVQPDVFLRARRNKRQVVMQKFEAASVPFFVEENCFRLPNGTNVDEVIVLDNDAVVQDKSSQQSLNGLLHAQLPGAFSAWDCCAASGGKTILLHDHFPKAQLTVSDIRESILHNLRNRFKRAGIGKYNSFVADVSSSTFIAKQKFNVVICDAPCSGSGTWSRTPEQLFFFKKDRINHYAELQKKIAVNTAGSVKDGGYFLYITCSVFKKENEDVAEYIAAKTSLKLVKQEYFRGYEDKADTLFAALFLL